MEPTIKACNDNPNNLILDAQTLRGSTLKLVRRAEQADVVHGDGFYPIPSLHLLRYNKVKNSILKRCKQVCMHFTLPQLCLVESNNVRREDAYILSPRLS